MNLAARYSEASVVVTGASGFIGTHLCRYLGQLGVRTTGIYLNNQPAGSHAKWRPVDLRNLEAVKELIGDAQPDYIFHLASHVDGRRELDAVQQTFENNLTSTLNILTAAQLAGCCKRLVLTNSQEEPELGDSKAAPSSPYAASKFAASAYARMFHALYDLPAVIARVFMVYGPEQRDQQKIIPHTIINALAGKAPELSSGLRKIDWIYVSDVVDGLLALGQQPGIEGETIDLGAGHVETIKTIVEEIMRQVDPGIVGRFGAIPDRAMEQERLANIVETTAKLNWQPKVSLQQGLAKTIAWYREQGDV